MAHYKEEIIRIDLENGMIDRSFINRTIGKGDSKGNRFGGRLYRNGSEVNLTGATVTGYFIRANKTTVIMQGYVDGNMFYVILPESCYTIAGVFSLAIKVTGSGVTGTMRVIDGTVIDTVIGDIYDPSGIVPDLSELMDVIERAEDAAAAIAAFSITEELIEGSDYRLIVNVS